MSSQYICKLYRNQIKEKHQPTLQCRALPLVPDFNNVSYLVSAKPVEIVWLLTDNVVASAAALDWETPMPQ